VRRARRQAPRPRLPLIVAALAACARIEPPPGGPPDPDPPIIVAVTPDSGAVVPDFDGDLEIRFDEVIEESPSTTRGRVSGLASYVLLSPVDGETEVHWRRTRITIRPKAGWRPNTVYRLEIRPGIRDLRRNVSDSRRLILFSTGPAIPSTTFSGVAVDWTKSAPLRGAVIEARPVGDTVGYRTIADSVGGFRLDGIPPGPYLVYAVEDQNQNRALDRREAHDSVAIALDTSATVELWTLVRDTVPPRLTTAQLTDSVAARVESSLLLDPYQTIDPVMVRVRLLPDSTLVQVAALWREAAYDSVTRARAAARDTAAVDTARALPDTARARRDTAAAAARAALPRAEAAAREPAQDTTPTGRVIASRPRLSTRMVVEVAAPWQPASSYLIELFGLRSAAGVTSDTTGVVLTTPERAAEPDTAARPPR